MQMRNGRMRNGLLGLAVLTLATTAVQAGDLDRVPPVTDPLTKKECGSCHMAFQPAFLPAPAWVAILDNLANHYGEDASLPAATVAAIKDYHLANAGRSRKLDMTVASGELPRITTQRWWEKKHRKVAGNYSRPEIKSKANCAACHRNAERGDYEDD